jgi:hypothetical protein
MLSLYGPYQSRPILIHRLYRSWSVLRAQDVVKVISHPMRTYLGTRSDTSLPEVPHFYALELISSGPARMSPTTMCPLLLGNSRARL